MIALKYFQALNCRLKMINPWFFKIIFHILNKKKLTKKKKIQNLKLNKISLKKNRKYHKKKKIKMFVSQ